MQSYGLKLTNNEYQISARLALGCNQYPETTIFCNVCNNLTDYILQTVDYTLMSAVIYKIFCFIDLPWGDEFSDI
jgi:hypothetical protein